MNLFTKTLASFLILISGLFNTTKLQAHHPDQSYLYFRIYEDGIGGRFEMTAKDMNKALDLGLPDKMSMEIIEPHVAKVQQYLLERSRLAANGKTYKIMFKEPTVLNLEEMEDFVRFHFDLEGVEEIPDQLDIYYNVLFDKVPNHQGLVIVEYNWRAGIIDNEALFANVFMDNDTQQVLDLTDGSIWNGFVNMVKLGMWHIWIGLDHILFIIALILPSVVRRKEPDAIDFTGDKNAWIPVEKFKPAFFYIIKIITFFTIAHSITLALASLNIVNFPSWLVESIIAFSIALAALHNIIPIFKHKEWMIAFGFGLFHGFGFASVLGDKGMGGDYFVYTLLGFNIGVELGQILIICLTFPFLFLLRKTAIYPALIKYGSMVLILIAMYWVIERGFDVDLQAGAYFWKAYNSVFG